MSIEIIKGDDNPVAEFFSSPARPTPETDAFAIKFKTPCGEKYWVPVDLSRRLERERDEALDLLASEKITRNHIIKRSVEVECERDEARAERDILRSNKMSDPLLETTFKHLNRERDEACEVANGLAKQVERLRKGRDEAREQAQRLRVQLNHYTQANEMAEQAFRERDEAHKIADQAIEDLAWFNETNAQILRNKLEQLKEGAK